VGYSRPILWRRDALLSATILTIAANAIVLGIVYKAYGTESAGIWIATRSSLSVISAAQPSLVGGLVGLQFASMDPRTISMALGGSLITRIPVGVLAGAVVGLLGDTVTQGEASSSIWALAAYSTTFLITAPTGTVARACQRGDLLLACAVLEALAALTAWASPSLAILLAAQTVKELLKAGLIYSVATPTFPSRGLLQILFQRAARQYARDLTQVMAQTGDRAAIALAFGSTVAGSAGLGAIAAGAYSVVASNLYLWALPSRLRGDRAQDERIELEMAAMVSGNALLTGAASGIGTILLAKPTSETWCLSVNGFSFSAALSTLVTLLAWNAASGARRALPLVQCAAIVVIFLVLLIVGRLQIVSPVAALPLFASLATGWLLYSLQLGGAHRSIFLARAACIVLIASAVTRFIATLADSSSATALNDLGSFLLASLMLAWVTRERIAK
jgi:hypothetical protein